MTKNNLPNPFNHITHKTERTGAAIVARWMSEIIEKNHLDLGLPNVETGGRDNLFPDVVINKTRRSADVLVVFEFKLPFWDPFQEDDPKEPARQKAVSRRAKYFATSNFRELILWKTEAVNANEPEEQQIVNRYSLSEIYNINDIEEQPFKIAIKSSLEKFLKDLLEYSAGRKQEERMAIDELLIYRLQEVIKKLAYYYQDKIYDRAHKDSQFSQDLTKWFNGQGWDFAIETRSDYQKIARQAAYLLANKMLFYNALQIKRPDKLDRLEIPESLTKGGPLESCVRGFFNEVLKIDYETIFTADFVDLVAFLDSPEVVAEIKGLVNLLRRYDFSTLGYDVIGRIFERLIPEKERHHLGQYFTNSDIVDLILQFSVKHETDKIFDPACGAGTFLVRAYQQKKLLNNRLSHEEIISALWGNDIAKFPAHLATINLAINDLSVERNYPNIMQKDFFNLFAAEKGFELPENVRKVKLKQLGQEEKEIIYPRWFDCLVGNPPYTRQEEMAEMNSSKNYKSELIDKALSYGNGRKHFEISKRAGIYVYFFIHGTKFLANGGRFGFIVPNAWLDVEYGAGLQKLFLQNYKIITVIESKVERWFTDADINTVIVILEKADGESQKIARDNNLVRFVYLFKSLRHFIPPTQDIWEEQLERKRTIDKLIQTIIAHDDFYQNDELRIFPKKQVDLWQEGFDHEKQKYTGGKWGKYLRAPEIFFKILEKGKDKLMPLKEVADVRRGITTGVNEFFFLTEEEIKRLKIEKEFWMHQDIKGNWQPNYVIKNSRDCKLVVVIPQELKYRILMIHKDKKDLKGTNLLKYIQSGERRGFHKRLTCLTRGRWYDLGQRKPAQININYLINDVAHCFVGSVWVSDDFQELHTSVEIAPFLNSTLFWFFQNLAGRINFGGGLLKIQTYELKTLFVLSTEKYKREISEVFEKLASRPVEDIFKELGVESSEKVNFDKIRPDRRALDQIIMDKILGLTEEEQLEVYKAVVDLVKSRLDKAKSAERLKKEISGIDFDSAAENIFIKSNDIAI